MITRNLLLHAFVFFAAQATIAHADTVRALPVPMQNKTGLQVTPNLRIPPNSPAATVDLKSIPIPSANFTQIPVEVSVRGNSLGTRGYLVMTDRSEINIDISPKTYPGAIPAGRYLVRANMSNVGSANTMVMEGAGNSVTCPMQVRPGYQNIQPCELVMETRESPGISAFLKSTARDQITLDSIQVFKIQ